MIAMIMYYKEMIVMMVIHMVGLIRHAKYKHCLEESGQHSSMIFVYRALTEIQQMLILNLRPS